MMVKILTPWELLFISIAKTITDLARWLGTLLLFKSFISSNVLDYIFRFFSDWWLHLIFMHLTLDTGKLLTWNFNVVNSWKYYNYMVGFCRKIFQESLFDGIHLTKPLGSLLFGHNKVILNLYLTVITNNLITLEESLFCSFWHIFCWLVALDVLLW